MMIKYFRKQFRSFCSCLSVKVLIVLLIVVHLVINVIFKQRNHIKSIVQSFRPYKAKSTKYAAVYTPYHLTPGGGEKYLLTIAKSLQEVGFKLTIITYDWNVCKTIQCIQETANKLNVNINLQKVNLILIDSGKYFEQNRNSNYDVFFALGNEKTPQVYGIGKVNLYMCQFPFDLDRLEDSNSIVKLSSYDLVILNSYFSMSYYEKYILPYYIKAEKMGLVYPSIKILYPPTGSDVDVSVDKTGKSYIKSKRIVMLGRFFRGRQSKGHITAIATFKRLLEQSTFDISLYLVGNLQPGHEEYVEELKDLAKGYPIHFLISASETEVTETLASSTIFWHMTGIDEPTKYEDPASLEHFGISVVEAMSFGCVPIVLNRGGTVEIVTDGETGYVAANADDYIKYSIEVLDKGEKELETLAVMISEASKKFSTQAFKLKFSKMLHRVSLSVPFKDTVTKRYNAQKLSHELPPVVPISKSNFTAVIIEDSMNSYFKFCVCNAITHLEGKSSIIVYHSSHNGYFVHRILESIPNIIFIESEKPLRSINDYNNLLKSESFWRSIPTEKVLIFQSDSIILRTGIERYMKYDYIGKFIHLCI